MKHDRWVLAAAGALWVGAVGFGVKTLMDYRNTPGPAAEPAALWPADSSLRRAAGRSTLVLLAHPHCPCTRASINEVNAIVQAAGNVALYALFVRPREFPLSWEQTDSWRRAKEIPGAVVLDDEDGVEARRFDGRTSGQVLLYDAGGRLLYSGGVTAGRGHEGDNDGRRDVLALLRGEKPGPIHRNVFGCLLFGNSQGGPS